MKEQRRQAANTNLVAEKIKRHVPCLPGRSDGGQDRRGEDRDGGVINIPPQYRLNLRHYVNVICLIPLADQGNTGVEVGGRGRSYRKRLEDEVAGPGSHRDGEPASGSPGRSGQGGR